MTGGSSGIGRAIALRLASAGAQVVVTDVDVSGARAVAETINESEGDGAAIACSMDVTNEQEIEQAFETACLTYGGIDVLVSNAGIATCAPIDELNLSDWERNFAVNSTGHFLAARAAIRLFKAQGIGGNIVFVATKNVVAPGKDFGAYSASKAAEAQLAGCRDGRRGVRYQGKHVEPRCGVRAEQSVVGRVARGAGTLLRNTFLRVGGPLPAPEFARCTSDSRRRGGSGVVSCQRPFIEDHRLHAAGRRRRPGGVSTVERAEEQTHADPNT